MYSKLGKAIVLTTALSIGQLNRAACAEVGESQWNGHELHSMGMVVEFDLAKGAQQKEAVEAFSNAGNWVFSTYTLTATGGGNLSFGGSPKVAFPRWVRVTWRQGPGIDKDYKNGVFIGGTIIGDYKVEVLSRIPKEVFQYIAAARGRVIVLRFRIKDDGVLFAWDVQERVVHPNGGRGLVFSMHGGEFSCENNPKIDPDCTAGRLEDAPWYNPLWTRG